MELDKKKSKKSIMEAFKDLKSLRGDELRFYLILYHFKNQYLFKPILYLILISTYLKTFL